MRISLTLLSSIALLTSCSDIPRDAFYNHGTPESLLDLSLETVNVGLTSQSSIDELVDWVNKDQPSRAELHCAGNSPLCAQAQNVFSQFSVPVESVASQQNEAVLIYERVMARDCENRFIDNSINPYNMNHPTFGCSTAANMVQMVGDKRQFVSPNLVDFPDAERTRNIYRTYENATPRQNKDMQSLLQNVTSQ